MPKHTLNVLFDLDGTLLDTAKDFMYTINLMRKQRQQPPLCFSDFRKQVYGESNRMVSFGFNLPVNHPEFPALKSEFLTIYQQNNTRDTHFFPGVEALLSHFDNHRIQWGIVTNKPNHLMTSITEHFHFNQRAKCIVAGDTLSVCKPNPAPLLHACKIANMIPNNTIYVGDMETDIIAARAAGMRSIAVTYGYHSLEANPADWKADYVANQASDILDILLKIPAYSE